MKIEIPLEVLGLMSPLLSWVEGLEDLSMPETWVADAMSFEDRERAWLVRQLPSYSYDTIHEIVDWARPREAWPWERLAERSEDREPLPLPRSFHERRPANARPWTLDPPKDYDLAQVFDRIGDRYLLWSGGQVLIREGRMEELHELSLRFPVGHLIRHGHARAMTRGWITSERAEHLPEHMNLLPSNSHSLRSIVRRGLTESHLHLKGVHSAEENWADQLLKHLSSNALRGVKPPEKRLLILSRYAARVLALGVAAGELRDSAALASPFGLIEKLDELYFTRTRKEDLWRRHRFHETVQDYLRDEEANRRVSSLLENREAGWLLHWLQPGTHRLAHMTRRPGGVSFEEPRNILDYKRLLEKLHFHAHRLLVQLPPGCPEHHFLQGALFRYLIFRTHHWQLATQYGKTTGLRRFKRFYDAHQRRPPSEDPTLTKRLILDRLREWRGLRTLEGRVSPPGGAHHLMPWVMGYADKADEGRIRKFGLVIHFIKSDYSDFELRANRQGHPRLRYGRMRRLTRRKAFQLFRLLSTPHPAVPFIVGIDAANLELSSPPEIFAPAFRFLRALPIELEGSAHSRIHHLALDETIRALVARRRIGMTYHVGEDFRHLLSGLRAIHEAIEYFDAQPGDRLGHAIALALQPEVWAQQTGYQAMMPRLEWLDTLVWVLQLLGPGHEVAGKLGLEDRIQKLSWDVYKGKGRVAGSGTVKDGCKDLERNHAATEPDWSPLTLYDAWRLRQLDPYSLDVAELRKGRCRLKPPIIDSPTHRRWHHVQNATHQQVEEHVGSARAYYLLALYWFDLEVRLRGDQKILVDMQKDGERELWLQLFRDAQREMMRIVHERELVVEVNPSVNRVIGPMEKLEDHHIFRLTLDRERNMRKTVRVTINSDNPAVFNTSLAHEYYVLGEVLTRQGMPEAQVTEWLEWLRRNGEDYSFVRQLPDNQDPGMRHLLETCRREYRPTVRQKRERQEKMDAFWKWFRTPPELFRTHREERPEDLHRRLARLEREIESVRAAAQREGEGSSAWRARLDRLEAEFNRLRAAVVY